MANALTDFTKKREFLICMDSDGCVMDTVRIKHSTVMCPELIRVFALDDHADFITAAWDEINLQDEVEEAKAALYREQARKLKIENDRAEGSK